MPQLPYRDRNNPIYVYYVSVGVDEMYECADCGWYFWNAEGTDRFGPYACEWLARGEAARYAAENPQ